MQVLTVMGGGDGSRQSTVFRRFSDFAWLQTQLSLKFRGVLIPPLPDKAVLGALLQIAR
mgnify:CR=1 FL=1